MHHTREAVRVKVKKCENSLPPEWRKFSVDPQITSLEVLYSLLQKAFDIKSDFSIKYKAFDPAGNELYLSVLSDWDLDAAFLRIHNLAIQTATEPCLMLQIDIKPFTEVKDWETTAGEISAIKLNAPAARSGSVDSTFAPNFGSGSGTMGTAGGSARELMSPLQQSLGVSQKYVQHMQTKLPGLIMNQMEKTFSIVQKAFNLSEETMASLPPRVPLADNEFRLFLDALGQIQRSDELRKVIFFGGIEPSLRRVVWKHILNVYPSGMNGHQRMDYMRHKADHYYKLRDVWKTAVKQGFVVGELAYVTSMVKKDVLRTDRLHAFYAGSDDNQNIASLFNILTTFALNHPSVSYCQGMSDLASPLLVTMNDEAQAYICFCALMARVRGNFMLDGVAMTQKFAHLTEALSFYDPEFWEYLKAQQADDLLFCYRWLLLELKREFPFEDALRMLEVQWSSLKYETSIHKELTLYEREFVPITESSAPTTSSSLSSSFSAAPLSPSYLVAKQRENPYTKVCALRRQSSSASLSSLGSSMSTNSANRLDNTKRLNQSLDDNITQHAARRRRHGSSKAHQSLDETKMLMLMENAKDADLISLPTKETTNEGVEHTNVNANEENDDVFAPNVPNNVMSPKSNGEAQHFDFHPTNPFKEDAQLTAKCSPSKRSKTPPAAHKPVAKAFLHSSSSSSIAEDESSGGGDASNAHIPKGIAKLHNKNILSNYSTVSNIIAKQMASAATVSESVRRVGSSAMGNSSAGSGAVGGGHFKELKEKIAATSRKAGMCMSFDETGSSGTGERAQQKLVKNFNEFLNFAAINKSRIADKFETPLSKSNANIASNNNNSKVLNKHANDKQIMLASSTTTSPTHLQAPATSITTIATTTATTTIIPHPLVQLTKGHFAASSLDDSDSSSVPDTTWSGSTAATAIQQGNNLSNQSLHLELSSLSSAAHTPDRTPTFDKVLVEHTPEKGEQSEKHKSPATPPRDNVSLTPEDMSGDQEYYPMSTAISRELRLDAENLDRQVYGDPVQRTCTGKSSEVPADNCDIEYEKLGKDSLDLLEELKEDEIVACPDVSELLLRRRARDTKARSSIEPLQQFTSEFEALWTKDFEDKEKPEGLVQRQEATAESNSTISNSALNPFLDEALLLADPVASDDGVNLTTSGLVNSNSLPEVLVPISTADPQLEVNAPVEMATNAADEIAFTGRSTPAQQLCINGADVNSTSTDSTTDATALQYTPTIDPPNLPPPTEFGGGNPFLMFLCLTLLLQHRDIIIKTGMDYNEIAMHFDKMVRKHDVTRVLNQARRMYIDYLKAQNAYKQQQQAAAIASVTAKGTIAVGTGDINNSSSSSSSATNTSTQRFTPNYTSTATRS